MASVPIPTTPPRDHGLRPEALRALGINSSQVPLDSEIRLRNVAGRIEVEWTGRVMVTATQLAEALTTPVEQ